MTGRIARVFTGSRKKVGLGSSLRRMSARPSLVRYKPKSRLRTLTKTKKKSINQYSKMNEEQSGSESTVYYAYNKLNKFTQKLCKNTPGYDFTYNYATYKTCDIGKQENFIVGSMYTGNITQELSFQLGFGSSPTSPALAISLGYGATSANFAHSIIPWECRQESFIANATNIPVVLTLYTVSARRPGTVSTRTSPEMWFGDVAGSEGSTYGNQTGLVVGNTPFSSAAFCRHFRIHKVTHVMLAEGQVHRHVVHHKGRQKWFPWQDFAYGIDPTLQDSNITERLGLWTMACFHGTPVVGALDSTEVSSGNAKLTCVTKYDYTFKFLPQNNHYQSVRATIPQSFSGTNTKIVQMYTGQTQGVLTA